MNVKHLIELLEDCNQDEDVSILDFEGNCYCLVNFKYDPEYGICLVYS